MTCNKKYNFSIWSKHLHIVKRKHHSLDILFLKLFICYHGNMDRIFKNIWTDIVKTEIYPQLKVRLIYDTNKYKYK